MLIYDREEDMPLGEVEKGDGTVHHLVCHGSRRHVIHWSSKGQHCSVERCELNHSDLAIGKLLEK